VIQKYKAWNHELADIHCGHEKVQLNFTNVYRFLVLCEYSKFQIESSSYFSIQFDSKRAQLFEIFEYLPSPISYLTE